MTHLLTPEGLLSLKRLAVLPSLLAFDVDGTLAPMVQHFADAKVPVHTSKLLSRLSLAWPVAILTGRSVGDATDRLGFTPQYLFGNHGAERADHSVSNVKSKELNRYREFLHQYADEFTARKILLEDKGLSLALHYRLSENSVESCLWLRSIIDPMPKNMTATHGHQVINILLANAPDKGDALLAAMQDCGAVSALVVGDDDNDEPAFYKAPDSAVTVRIGPSGINTCARFRLSTQVEIDAVLTALCRLRMPNRA